jgi:hypothetical protein
MAVTCNRYKFVTVSILKSPHGSFRSLTTTWIKKWFKTSAVLLESFIIYRYVAGLGISDQQNAARRNHALAVRRITL